MTGPFDGYADEPRPLGGYVVVMAAFQALAGGATVAFRRSGRELPERIGAGDVVLVGAATHKLSRLLAKDKVFSPLRAPFTRYVEPAGEGEVSEEPRGRGLRLAIGELLVCPYCLGFWVASAFTGALVFSPRLTRLIATTFTALGVSDALQMAYRAGKQS